MQASLAHDWFKGGWSATWESTGGPQQLSGGKAGFWPEASTQTAGFTVDEGTIAHLMFSYLAAGFKGFCLWCWNARTAGWEAGEYALLDRQNRPTPRAERAGQIAQAARRYRDELWQAHKEPMVGVFSDFENDAFWAAISVHGREHFKHVPMKGRVGASRALINRNIPWEYVTGTDVCAGLADRYPVIYLPVAIVLKAEWLRILHAYVERGGRLVMDLPGAWYDEFGRLLDTRAGSAFEKLFGCTLRDLQYASNVPRSVGGRTLSGFVADIEPTRADGKVLETYGNGEAPAITETAVGKGSALLLGYEASLCCYRPGNDEMEARLSRYALGGKSVRYRCADAIVYRLAAPEADHYFLLNDGEEKHVTLESDLTYRTCVDAVSQEELKWTAPILLPAHDGRWLRCEKDGPGARAK
jgi:beta-galactosidase